ncbi:hypothetical protein [Streptomyces sp. NPDC053560]|uniref:hypothetical protein n=1 Tax=Streptomyces sp. NPDC053560 TaxID=3365711 RepID=UPI0037D6D65D
MFTAAITYRGARTTEQASEADVRAYLRFASASDYRMDVTSNGGITVAANSDNSVTFTPAAPAADVAAPLALAARLARLAREHRTSSDGERQDAAKSLADELRAEHKAARQAVPA